MISDFHLKSRKELLKTPIVQQTSFWSEVKKNMGVESLAFDFRVHGSAFSSELTNGNTSSDVLVLINKVGKDASIAYIPYDPEYEPLQEDEGLFLAELSECIRGYLPTGMQ